MATRFADTNGFFALRGMASAESAIRFERQLIIDALRDSAGNKTEAARRLGVQRRLLYAKIAELGI